MCELVRSNLPDCREYYNCCDCGGNSCCCIGCYSCNRCEECTEEDNQ